MNCIYQGINCIPQTIVAYENIIDTVKGPAEINKIAKVIEGKPGLVVIEEEARECVFHKTLKNKELPHDVNQARQ